MRDGEGNVMGAVISMLPLAAADSLNLLAFSLLGYLWVTAASGRHFRRRASALLLGAGIGVLLAFAVSLSVVGPAVSTFLPTPDDRSWWIGVCALGVVLVVLGIVTLAGASPRRDDPDDPPATDATALDSLTTASLPGGQPPRPALRRFLHSPSLTALTGGTIYVIQNATSIPFYGAVGILTGQGLAVQVLGVVFFVLIALSPAVGLGAGLIVADPARGAQLLSRVTAVATAGTRVVGALFVLTGVLAVAWAAVRLVTWG